jgi:cytochrome c oxidase subunit I+III
MLGMVAIFFTVLAALIYSYYYLRLYSDQWPQMGLPLPELTGPVAAYAALGFSGLAHIFNVWARMHRRRSLLIAGMAAVLSLGLIYCAVETANLIALPFRPSANAYASIVFALNGFVILMVLTAAALLAGSLIRIVRLKEPLDNPRLELWLQNSELLWFFAAAAGILTFFTTYMTPYIL